MAKQVFDISATPTVITTPALYEATIEGMDSILFNKLPDLSNPKAKAKAQAKTDPLENEWATWRDKLYSRDDGSIYIPGENIHECFKEGAKYWGMRIPGEGQKTYTDVVASAMVVEDADLGMKKDDESIIPYGRGCNGTPGKGKKSGTKVYKIRPLVRPWGCNVRIHVYDARLNEDIIKTVIAYAGAFRGLCDWRPKFGRFTLTDLARL